MNRPTWLISYVALIHVAWAGLLVLSPTAGHATTTSALVTKLPLERGLVVILLLLASACAFWVLFGHPKPSHTTAWLLFPQQVLLLLAAIGAAEAITFSHFADGVVRSRSFIAADQCWVILLCFAHVSAYLRWHAGSLLSKA